MIETYFALKIFTTCFILSTCWNIRMIAKFTLGMIKNIFKDYLDRFPTHLTLSANLTTTTFVECQSRQTFFIQGLEIFSKNTAISFKQRLPLDISMYHIVHTVSSELRPLHSKLPEYSRVKFGSLFSSIAVMPKREQRQQR